MKRCERGSTLIVAIFLVTMLTLLGIGVVTTAMTDYKVSDSYVRSLQALYAADAGLNDAVGMLQLDPTIGLDVDADPDAAPQYVKDHFGNEYSIWVWDQRLWGNGEIEEFADPAARQVVVVGTDGRRSNRRIEAIIEPARSKPGALGFATFSCGDSTFDEFRPDMAGKIYASGNMVWPDDGDKGCELYVTGNLNVSGKVKKNGGDMGNVFVNGDLTISKDVEKDCFVGGSISNSGKCKGTAYSSLTPLPVIDYCDTSAADYDPEMLDLTAEEVQDLRDTATTTYPSDWTVNVDTAITGTIWVDGNVHWSKKTFTYSGETVLVVDGSFTCHDHCRIEGTGQFSVIATAGDIVFSKDSEGRDFNGVLWAGMWSETSPPTVGNILIDDGSKVDLNGAAVAIGNILVTNSKFDVISTEYHPTAFGVTNGYAVTEWLEARF